MPASQRGGRRPRAGRPRLYTEPLLRKTVTLSQSYIWQLERVGNGNLSDGIRFVLEFARTPSGARWLEPPEPNPTSHRAGDRPRD